MVTSNWNIKLMGNITETEFKDWIVSANIPRGYNFSVSKYDSKRQPTYWESEHESTSTIVPDEDNTIIITGREGVVDFKPYCYTGNRCIMMAEKNAFYSGTELFSLLLTCDGLLDRAALEQLYAAVPLGGWIEKNMPSYKSSYDNINTVDESGYIDESTQDGVKLKNAVCQYVTKVLGLWKKSTTTPTQDGKNQ